MAEGRGLWLPESAERVTAGSRGRGGGRPDWLGLGRVLSWRIVTVTDDEAGAC